MKITPIDIQQVSFDVRFRGYNRKEVDNFLDLLAHDYEMLIKESQEIKEKTASLEIQVMELKKKEATLNSTLIAVQKVVDEMKQNAQKEVDLLIKEAELKAEEITQGAQVERLRLQSEIKDLQRQKVLFLEKIRSVLRAFEKTVELEEKDLLPDRKGGLKVG
ncbi:MAG TPA: DivIVA domain-containing protein [Nitrospiria bacterium]|nr:DivIVA domain-containing protein [Nitrospiria bacterium]